MKALSIRQPWAYAIFHLSKDVENRSWPTRYRGRKAVHVAKRIEVTECRRLGLDPYTLPTWCVIGTVEVSYARTRLLERAVLEKTFVTHSYALTCRNFHENPPERKVKPETKTKILASHCEAQICRILLEFS